MADRFSFSIFDFPIVICHFPDPVWKELQAMTIGKSKMENEKGDYPRFFLLTNLTRR